MDVEAAVIEEALELIRKNIPSEATLLNLYYWGSRIFENAKADSDWDFLAIVSDHYIQPAIGNVAEGENVDVSIVSLSKFQSLLDDHVPWAIPFYYFPSRAILQAKYELSFSLEYTKAKKALLTNYEVNMRQAKGFWRDGNFKKAKKRVFHVLQMICFLNEILTTGTLDLCCANGYYGLVIEKDYKSWEEYSKLIVQGLTETELNKFKEITGFFYVHQLKHPACPLLTQKFLEEYPLDLIKRNYSVIPTAHGVHPNLIHFRYTPISRWESRVVCECNGIVLDRNKGWKAVSFPFERIFHPEFQSSAKFDWSKYTLTKALDGKIASLYFYAGQWHLSSFESADGSEVICSSEGNKSFASIFWELWTQHGFMLPDESSHGYCFMFEVIHPSLRNIIYQSSPELYFSGVRNLESLKEEDISGFAQKYKWNTLSPIADPSGKPFTLEQLQEQLKTEQDTAGYIATDLNFNRVIIMTPLFRTLLLVQNLTGEDPLEVEHLLLLSLPFYLDSINLKLYPFAESLQTFNNIREKYCALCNTLDQATKDLSHLTDFKQFGDEAQRFGKQKFFLLGMKKYNFTSSQAYFANKEGGRRKLELAILRWWDQNHKTSLPRQQHDFK